MLTGLDHECIVKYYDFIETNYEEVEVEGDSISSFNSSPPSSPTSSLSSYSSAGLKDGKIYLVMEWLGDGCNLSHWMAGTKDSRSLESVKCILRKLMEALEYLKGVGITHHDIKLDNIIFNESQQTVKLIDFGVSESCSNDESFCAYGTPAYQAPEILTRSDPSIDRKSVV